jgi:hypothetical protein
LLAESVPEADAVLEPEMSGK